jgi:hypothetical protein
MSYLEIKILNGSNEIIIGKIQKSYFHFKSTILYSNENSKQVDIRLKEFIR